MPLPRRQPPRSRRRRARIRQQLREMPKALRRGGIGRRSERRAARFLRRRGLRLLTRNYGYRGGEIDLVMLDGETLVFVEVRFRGAGAWCSGLESVDAAKQRRLARTAERYLAKHPQHGFRAVRFDVVSATARSYSLLSPVACEWIPDAFDAPHPAPQHADSAHS